MALRQRERIHRHTAKKQTCEACGSSMLDTWSRQISVGGQRLNLCSTCQSEARGEDGEQALKAYLRAEARHRPDVVNDDVLRGL
jgi:hypothetical protein